MRIVLPRAKEWSQGFQDTVNGVLENSFARLNEYALVPAGGAAGQLLVKTSARDFDLSWSSVLTLTAGLNLAALRLSGSVNNTIPTLGALGALHIVPTSGVNDSIYGISFGANSSGTVNSSAQAGIYAQSGAAYGLRLKFFTTNNFSADPVERMVIGENGNITINPPSVGNGLTIGNAVATTANIDLQATVGVDPLLTFYRVSSGVGVGMGRISWEANNASGTRVQYARIQSEIVANTAGAHTGRINFDITSAGALVLMGTWGPSQGLIVNAPVGADTLTLAPSPGTGALVATSAALTNNAGASAGTLTNAPAAGNPTKWIKINDGGTIRSIPAW